MNWSERFNNLSLEHRKIGSAHEAQLRVQHLKFEKQRLITRHKQSLKEINDYIKGCEATLEKLDKEINTPTNT